MPSRRTAIFAAWFFVTLSLLSSSGWPVEKAVTEIVATQRPAEELLPALLPMTSDDLSVQAYQGQLILHGPASRIADMKEIIRQLDRPLRNLRISVRRASSTSESDDSTRLRVRDGHTTIEQRNDSARSQGNDVQQLTALEGTAAWLSTDTEVPLLGIAPSGAEIPSYAPLGNGLELLPQVSGDQVRLGISQRIAALEGGEIRTQTIQSVLMLAPGVWTSLGGVDAGETQTGGGIDHRRATRRSGKTNWEVMVELLP